MTKSNNITIFTLLLALSISVISENSNAQDLTELTPSQVNVIKPVEDPRSHSRYLASVNYSAVDMPFPGKLGVSLGLIASPTQTWELEYMKGGLSVPGGFRNLASIDDTRLGLIGRRYYGKSFYLSYGASYFNFSANLGDNLLNNVSSGTYPNIDMMTVQGLGLNVGIGNNWVFRKNITLGVDWFSWAQPLVITKKSSEYLKYASNSSDKAFTENTMKIVGYLPRFALLNIHLGMLF